MNSARREAGQPLLHCLARAVSNGLERHAGDDGRRPLAVLERRIECRSRYLSTNAKFRSPSFSEATKREKESVKLHIIFGPSLLLMLEPTRKRVLTDIMQPLL